MSEPVRLFFTRTSEAWDCPKKEYWRNNKWLIPTGINPNFTRGSYVHEVMEHAVAHGLANPSAEDEERFAIGLSRSEKAHTLVAPEDHEMARAMVFGLWKLVKDQHIIEVEKTYEYEGKTSDGIPYIWTLKADSMIKEMYGIWQGEYKTTKVYSSTIQNFYHNGIQPWCYLWFLVQMGLHKNLQGVRLFVASRPLKNKPKGMTSIPPNAVKEDIPMNRDNLFKAQEYIEDSVRHIHRLTETGVYPKNRNACLDYYGECSYAPLCAPRVENNEEYLQGVVKNLFKKEDPEDHLKKKEEKKG